MQIEINFVKSACKYATQFFQDNFPARVSLCVCVCVYVSLFSHPCLYVCGTVLSNWCCWKHF